MVSQETSLYDAIGGDATFTKIVHGFYVRVAQDDILGPMYPADDLPGAERRLKLFLAQYWGGPHTYQIERGHPRLRMRHLRFPIDSAASQRWLELMAASLDELSDAELPPTARTALWEHMQRAAAMLINQAD